MSFSGLLEPFSLPIIMFFVYEQRERRITALVGRMKQDAGKYYRTLKDNFRPVYFNFPHYNPAFSQCKFLKFMLTDRKGDKFTGFGSFVNLPTGFRDCLQHFEALRVGMGEDCGIWSAGEYISLPSALDTNLWFQICEFSKVHTGIQKVIPLFVGSLPFGPE